MICIFVSWSYVEREGKNTTKNVMFQIEDGDTVVTICIRVDGEDRRQFSPAFALCALRGGPLGPLLHGIAFLDDISTLKTRYKVSAVLISWGIGTVSVASVQNF